MFERVRDLVDSPEDRSFRRSRFYRIETCDGGRLKRPRHDYVIANGGEGGDDFDVVGFVPDNAPDHVYLFSSAGWNSPLSLRPALIDRPLIVALKIVPGDGDGVHLKGVETGLYLSAAPRPGDGDGFVCLDRETPGDWERFRLREIDHPVRSASLRKLLRAIVGAIAALDPRQAPADRGEAPERAVDGIPYECLGLCRDYLSGDQVSRVAARVGADLLGTGRLIAHDGRDFWADVALTGLKEWLKAGRPRGESVRVIDPSLDHLDAECFDGRYANLSHEVNCRVRSGVAPRKRSCILTTARNEGPYLVDWVAYHREIGFEQIFIYSNDNDDGSDAILRRLAELGLIVWIDNVMAAGRRPQNKAYAHALSVLPDILDYEWVAIIDLDELVWFDAGRFADVNDYLAFQSGRGSDVVRLTWSMITSDGQDAYRREPLFDRFRFRMPDENFHTKSIVRSRLSWFSTPHYPILIDERAARHTDAAGAPFEWSVNRAFSARPLAEPACINHYFFKSRDEFASKFSRNRGDHYLLKGEEIAPIPEGFASYFSGQFASPDVVPARAPRACAPSFDRAREGLLADPAIRAALETAEAWHLARSVKGRGQLGR